MRKVLIIFFTLVAALSAYCIEIEKIPNVQLSDSTQFVSDPFNMLKSGTRDNLNKAIQQLRAQTTAEVVVVMIDAVPDDTDVETYATDLFNKWGLGQKDVNNGVLVLVSRDDRAVTIRTGHGIDGVLPDITCGRIIRDRFIPAFKNDDYDSGVTAGVAEIARILTDPDNIADVKSGTRTRNNDNDNEWRGFLFSMGGIMVLITLGLLLWILYLIYSTRKDDVVTCYERLDAATLPSWCLSALTLGLGLIPTAILWAAKKKIRSRHPNCPNCNHEMIKMDEESDNAYLTPAQDAEERLKSVDYDVWVCPECNEIDILPFINKRSDLIECPNCHARACGTTGYRVIVKPTTQREGRGITMFKCQNCGHTHNVPYAIAKTEPPVVVVPGGRGGSGGGFGGFGGGGFGGGMSMGGGATGHW